LRADLVEAQRAFDIVRTVLVNDEEGHSSIFHTLVFYQFKQLMGAATQWFLSLLGFYDTFLVRGH
jgi:hypothetical protein